VFATVIYHHDIDPPLDQDVFWPAFGAVRRSIAAGLSPFRIEGAYPRYVAGKHDEFQHIVSICQLGDFISLAPDRSLAEQRALAFGHEDLLAEEVTFKRASFEEIVLADIVAVTVHYEFEVAGSIYSFRLQNFIFPGDARFDLLRMLAPGSPDLVERAELSSVHAGLVYEAEEWSRPNPWT